MSERKRPEAEEAMLRLLVDDAEQYDRMVAEGHRELCLDYQPLIPALVDAAVMGRQVTGELKEARDYLKECPVCAEALESSSKALRELAAEDGQSEDEPYEPPRPDPPPAPKPEPGKLEAWWVRFTRTRAGLISIVGGVLCVIALVGLFLQSGRQCAREEARRDHTDAAVPPGAIADAGPRRAAPDAAVDPRSLLRKKGPLYFAFITLHLAGLRQRDSLKVLLGAERELKRFTGGSMAPDVAALKKLAATVGAEIASVERLGGPIHRVATFLAAVKDDGKTPDFAAELAAAKKQLAERQAAQTRLRARLAALSKRLRRWK